MQVILALRLVGRKCRTPTTGALARIERAAKLLGCPPWRIGSMKRRTFLGTALGLAAGSALSSAAARGRWDDAAEVLEKATAAKQVDAAVLHVAQKKESFTRHFGKAASADAMFLLGSISKP